MSEVTALLDSDSLARLASIDEDGYPHVTPLWFHWDGEVLRMTSLPGKPHVDRLRRNPRVGVVVDVEDDERSDGQRPNRQVRFVGDAEVVDDVEGEWTRNDHSSLSRRAWWCRPGGAAYGSEPSGHRVAPDREGCRVERVALSTRVGHQS